MSTFPLGLLVDDAGAVLDAPVVVISSVLDKTGAPITGSGATVNGNGSATPISVDYDAEGYGEAWIVLDVSQSGKTVTGTNAAKVVFAGVEKAQIAAVLASLTDATITLAPDTLTGTMNVYASGAAHTSGNLLHTIALARSSTGQPFSFTRQ